MAFDQDLTSKLDAASGLVNNYVVAPIAGFGVGGFKFSTFKEYKGELKATSSDNYNEKNIALQDIIANAPEIFSLSGIVAEINYLDKDNQATTKGLAQKLTTIAGFLPLITSTVKSLQSAINSNKGSTTDYLDAGLSSALDLYQTYQKLNPPKTEQAKAYNYFSALRNARVLISFDTPFGFKSNFMIMDCVMTQPEWTQTKSDVILVLKEMRFATTSTVKFDPTKYQGRSVNQKAPIDDKGIVQGQNDKKDFGSIIAKTFGF